MEKLKNFVIQDKFIISKTQFYLTGTINELPAIVEFTFKDMNGNDVKDFFSLNHKSFMINDVYKTYVVDTFAKANINVICPANFNDFKNTNTRYEMGIETLQDYLDSSEIVHEVTPSQNVFEDDNIILREKVNGGFFCYFKNPKYHSLRDIDHYSVLKNSKLIVKELLEKRGLKIEDFCMYFEYEGKLSHAYYQIRELNSLFLCNIGSNNGKFIYLNDAIKNLKLDQNYYRRDIIMMRAV